MVIRYSSHAIRPEHRQEMDRADESLQSARKLLDEAETALAGGVEISTGFLTDAQKEYAEGRITLALVRGQHPPTPEELRVDPVAFLHGLAESLGEISAISGQMRRAIYPTRGFLSD
jgi:translin